MNKDETSPETPLAKTNSDPPPPPDGWQAPRSGERTSRITEPPPSSNTNVYWAMGNGSVRTYSASGPTAVVLFLVALLVVGALFALFFVFAVGIGSLLAVGTGALALLGYGAKRLRKQLPSKKPREIGEGEP